jgi:hypothetical protein
MSLVSTIFSRVGYRLGGGITISSTSDPTEATFIAWLNETALWLTGICAEMNSDLGRTIGSITTLHAAITAATAASPCSVTATAHGLLSSGTCTALVHGVVGMTELNDTEYTATYVSANAVTLGIDSTDYTTYTSGGYITRRDYSTLATTMYCPAHYTDSNGDTFEGWIVKSGYRAPLKLKTESILIDYTPTEHTEPSEYYVDGSNNICFPSYPDDDYTIKIPYYTLPTAITATTDTVPFLGLFDNVIIEALAWRAMNRDEYDVSVEFKWQSFLNERAVRVIAMRKKTQIGVGL